MKIITLNHDPIAVDPRMIPEVDAHVLDIGVVAESDEIVAVFGQKNQGVGTFGRQ
ncbi:MAG TPA: hypothetical protein VGJ05_06300 [Fimbriiglobus sp.]